jgi:hypothetical protein
MNGERVVPFTEVEGPAEREPTLRRVIDMPGAGRACGAEQSIPPPFQPAGASDAK